MHPTYFFRNVSRGSFYRENRECRRLASPVRITLRPIGTPELVNVAALTDRGVVLCFLPDDALITFQPPAHFASSRALVRHDIAPLAHSVFEWEGQNRNTRKYSVEWHGVVSLLEEHPIPA